MLNSKEISLRILVDEIKKNNKECNEGIQGVRIPIDNCDSFKLIEGLDYLLEKVGRHNGKVISLQKVVEKFMSKLNEKVDEIIF